MNTVPHSASNDNLYTVYALIDPRDNTIRYIGITYNLYQRMRQHSRCEGNNAAKNAWIQELQDAQLMFIMQSLEKVYTVQQALERELYWIDYYLSQGANLFNIAGVNPIQSGTTGDLSGHISKRKLKRFVSDEMTKILEVSRQNVKNIPIHIEPWILMDYPIVVRNQKLITVEQATPDEFGYWLSWNEIDSSLIIDCLNVYAWKGLGWTFEYKYLVINHILDQGFELKLADGTVIEPTLYEDGVIITYHGKD